MVLVWRLSVSDHAQDLLPRQVPPEKFPGEEENHSVDRSPSQLTVTAPCLRLLPMATGRNCSIINLIFSPHGKNSSRLRISPYGFSQPHVIPLIPSGSSQVPRLTFIRGLRTVLFDLHFFSHCHSVRQLTNACSNVLLMMNCLINVHSANLVLCFVYRSYIDFAPFGSRRPPEPNLTRLFLDSEFGCLYSPPNSCLLIWDKAR